MERINKKFKKCIKCKKSIENCTDDELIIIGDLQHLAHKTCVSLFDI